MQGVQIEHATVSFWAGRYRSLPSLCLECSCVAAGAAERDARVRADTDSAAPTRNYSHVYGRFNRADVSRGLWFYR